MTTNEEVLEQVEDARAKYHDLRDALAELGRLMRSSEKSELRADADRFDAYNPGMDPGRDWGMGQSAESWFDEIERHIFGREEED